MTTARLTPAQATALRAMAAADGNLGYAGHAGLRIPTARALIAKGLIEVVDHGGYRGTEVVSNAFGRGWHLRPVYREPVVRLTDAGRQAADEVSA